MEKAVKKKQYIDKLLDSLDWEAVWASFPEKSPFGFQRFEDDSIDGTLQVSLSVDGDSWIKTYQKNPLSSLRFRVEHGGGGQSPRVRQALIILMMAIKRDNEYRPQARQQE